MHLKISNWTVILCAYSLYVPALSVFIEFIVLCKFCLLYHVVAGTCWQTKIYKIHSSAYKCSTYGRRAFSIAGPTIWNSLPDELTDPARSFDSFRQFLKTILFSLY